MTTRTAKAGLLSRRMIIAMVAMGIIALALGYFVHPVYAADNFNAGQNGTPTDGTNSDLLGGTASFTFEQDAVLSCDGDTATSFDFTVNYDVTGTLPEGATLVVYLSPNQGAINNNAGGDDAGYIADVESNYTVADVGGLTGTGSFDVTVETTGFQLSGGGVLGVFASEDGGQSWSGKTNSLQCSEAQSVAESASVPELESASVPASGEQSIAALTFSAEASTADSAFFGNGVNALPTILFSLILLASLGTLAYANVKSVRS